MPEVPRRVRYRMTRSRDYRVVVANGAIGGLGANGIIHLDFYLERGIQHEETLVDIDPSKRSVSAEVPAKVADEPVIVRESQVGLVVTPETALALAQWLMGQVERSQAPQAEAEDKDAEGLQSNTVPQ
jgi:hypothetical protein